MRRRWRDKVAKMKKIAMPLLFIGFASMLAAQEFRYGAQAGIAFPLGDAGTKDYLNFHPGLALGGHAVWNFQQGQALVPRIDLAFFQRAKGGNDLLPLSFKSSVTLRDIKIGVDYNKTIKILNVYGIAGLGYSSFEWPIPAEDGIARKTKGSFYFALGLGYKLTDNFLAEARFMHAAYSDVGMKGVDRSAPTLTASLLWRY
jgi:hypothetical protein